MRKKFFIRSLMISLLSILIFAVCSSFIMFQIDKQQHAEKIELYLATVLSYQDISDDYQLQANNISDLYGTDLRVTIIDINGFVLADSVMDSSQMENHSDREEIIDAIAFGEGTSVRYSTTIKKNVLYVAIKTDTDVILRGMIPISSLLSNLIDLMPYIFLAALIAFIISIFTSKISARDSMKPLLSIIDQMTRISHGEYSASVAYSEYNELNDLVTSINALTGAIHHSMEEINTEKDKLSFILNNISQGVILLDDFYKIVHCNDSARKVFDLDRKPGMTLFELTRKNTIINAVEKAKENIATHFELPMNNSKEIYNVSVLPVADEAYEGNVFLIFTDITQSKNNEKLRKEFFSNASHELRTPITSIMGFSEMISNNIEDDPESIKNHASIIHRESEKLSALLNDMLVISSLEESNERKPSESLMVKPIIQEVIDGLSGTAIQKNIDIHLECDDTTELGIDKHNFINMMMNLVENGIKYGKEDGNIWITVKSESDKTVITVKDDGIGIDRADLPRIFERLYRVDKSRNSKIRGTGLGLSIVKHIVQKYKGEISVESTLNAGTEFTIIF